MNPKNTRLTDLIRDWRNNGAPEQEGFSWYRSKPKWAKLAQDFDVDIGDFPEFIDRQFLWTLSSRSDSAKTTFLAIMIWGYGDIGYGPYRVRHMFASPGFEASIEKVKGLCKSRRTLEAYRSLMKSNISQLGPSFGTKVLTFFHEQRYAPAILDSIVAWWLNQYAPELSQGSPVHADRWNDGVFEAYNNWITKLSISYDIPGCSLEELIFNDGYSSR